jgi:hypothetical protein
MSGFSLRSPVCSRLQELAPLSEREGPSPGPIQQFTVPHFLLAGAIHKFSCLLQCMSPNHFPDSGAFTRGLEPFLRPLCSSALISGCAGPRKRPQCGWHLRPLETFRRALGKMSTGRPALLSEISHRLLRTKNSQGQSFRPNLKY